MNRRELEFELNTVAAERIGESGLEHAYLLGAEHALEWALGGYLTPTERFALLESGTMRTERLQ